MIDQKIQLCTWYTKQYSCVHETPNNTAVYMINQKIQLCTWYTKKYSCVHDTSNNTAVYIIHRTIQMCTLNSKQYSCVNYTPNKTAVYMIHQTIQLCKWYTKQYSCVHDKPINTALYMKHQTIQLWQMTSTTRPGDLLWEIRVGFRKWFVLERNPGMFISFWYIIVFYWSHTENMGNYIFILQLCHFSFCARLFSAIAKQT